MPTIDVYYYKNILQIQVIDPAIFNTRNRVVYARPIKIYQGIDNAVHVVTRNQDQKSVSLAGHSMQIDIQDPQNKITVASFVVSFVNQAQGLGMFTVPKNIVNALDQRNYELTAKLINNESNVENALYIDDNHSVALMLQVQSAYFSTDPVTPGQTEGIVDLGVLS